MDDETRLDSLQLPWTTDLFSSAIDVFLSSFGLTIQCLEQGGSVPILMPDQRQTLKYGGYYEDAAEELRGGGNLRVATILKETRVVGIGVAEPKEGLDGAWSIEIISVDIHARRSKGWRVPAIVGGQEFTVGAAHALVRELVNGLPRPIYTDATSAGSRYVFKALGFRHRAGTTNPCLLILNSEKDVT